MRGISSTLLLPTDEDRRRGVSFWLILGALVLLAGVPRLYRLGHPGFSGNEDYAAIAARAIREEGIPRFPSGVVYPRALLVSYVTAASTGLLGADEMATRLPWALLSALGVGLAYAFARRTLGREVALLAGLFLALSSWEIATARTARMYAPLSVAFLFALHAMHRVAFEDDRRFRVPSLVATVLTCSLHQLGATLAVPYGVVLLMRGETRRRGFVALSLALTILCAGAVILFEKYHYAPFEEKVAARAVTSGTVGGDLDQAKGGPRLDVPALAVLACGLAAAFGWRGPRAALGAALGTVLLLAGMQQLVLAFYAAAAYLAWVAFVRRRWSWRDAATLVAVLGAGTVGWLAWHVAGPPGLSPVRALREVAGFPPNFLEIYARRAPLAFVVAGFGMLGIVARFFRERPLFAPHVVVVSTFALTATALGFYPEARFNERYVFHLDPYFAFLFAAGAWWLAAGAAQGVLRGETRARHGRALALVLAIGLMLASGGISPGAAVAAADQGYGANERLRQAGEADWFNPDHAGSSRFACSRAAAEDFIVPMDVLIHHVYCPRTDVQLTLSAKGDAEGWIGVRSVDSLRALAAELEGSRARRIWIVISGQAIHSYGEDPRLPAIMAFTRWECARRAYSGRDGLSDVWVMDRGCFLRQARE